MFTKAPLLFVLTTALAPFALAQDTVRLRSGATETGKVESEDFDALKLKVKKEKEKNEQTISIPWDNVADINYSGAADYTKALVLLNTGQSTAAIPLLKGVLASAGLRKEMRPAVAFQLGSAQMRNGAFADASATFLDLLKTGAKTRYLIPATRSLVEIALTTNDPNAGTTSVDTAIAAAKEAGVPVTNLVAFDYFRGLLNEAKNDLVNARVSFQAASRGEGPAATIADMAKLGIARVEMASGKVEEARNAYRGLVDKGRGNEVLAGAWNGLAKIALADAVKAKNAEKINDALFMYLRGVVQFAPAPGEGTGEYERALAGAAEAFKSLSDIENDENLKKENANRSRARLDQLKKEFPYSVHLPK